MKFDLFFKDRNIIFVSTVFFSYSSSSSSENTQAIFFVWLNEQEKFGWKEQRYRLCSNKRIKFPFAQFFYPYAQCPVHIYPIIWLHLPQNKSKFYFQSIDLTRHKFLQFQDCCLEKFIIWSSWHHLPKKKTTLPLYAETQLYRHMCNGGKWLHRTSAMNCSRDGFLRKLLAKELTESKYHFYSTVYNMNTTESHS